MFRLVFFSRVREQLGVSELQWQPRGEVHSVADLLGELQAQGADWETVLGAPNLLVAVNQEMSGPETALQEGDEVAFFPPVTGG